ncbi:MAG: porin, partial [Cyanobacteria bacterium K_DeepCast_0m_m1_088]|nr:porin [Cyanobacteria bacterium K_DeepCast_0m_m1_088]
NKYAAEEQVTSISQFSDVKPTDWAYQALSNLIERYGCVAGYPSGTYAGGKAMTRFEAAALLNACLDRVTEVTDELKKLMAEFEKELAILKGRVDGLEAKVGELEAQQFSTTTKLSGLAIMTIGGTDADGADELSFNYDVRLSFLTSFTGKDLLKTTLRSGNFDTAYAAVGGLEYGYANGSGAVEINRLFYQFPVGDFKFTLGAVTRQDDMLGMFPSLYPSDSMLDITTYAGVRGVYNLTFGSGAGVTYAKNGFNASLLFVTPKGVADSQADGDGLFSDAAMYTAQVGYAAENWGVAAAYTGSDDYNQYGLSAYWAPETSGLIPSISAGFGFGEVADDDTTSWTVGLVWSDAFVKGNSLGIAVGAEGTGVTGIIVDGSGDDDIVIEGYYKFQATDNISVTPGVFYLDGADVFGAVVKTTFTF